MGEMEELRLAVGHVQQDVAEIKGALPKIAEALTELTLINDRQLRDSQEHREFWERIDEHGDDITRLKLKLEKISTIQTECIKRQGVEHGQEAAKSLQDRGTISAIAVNIVVALITMMLTLVFAHGSDFFKKSDGASEIHKAQGEKP
ncbi:hypothetical protein [Oryzomonas rubra]|uniref:Uncharacterized protein n=1 Tax=Oryzomonas rubra TaxID=2509454 RepID=A0A5A9X8Q0_9BACT|nr:hypothetical protein [Oryzomonas rubra]KAA0888785.1 hypothetical protein ET418_15505 [Oryzomonas rubra]